MISNDSWTQMLEDLRQSDNMVTLIQLARMIYQYSGYMLTLKDKEFLLEVYRIKSRDIKAKAAVNNDQDNESATVVEVQPFAGKGSISVPKQKVVVLEINNKVVQMKNLEKIREEQDAKKFKAILEMEKSIEAEEEMAYGQGKMQID